MYFSKIKTFFFWWLLLCEKTKSVDINGIIANASYALAEFYSVNCIYFINIGNTTDDQIPQKLAKKIADKYEKSFTFLNLSKYNLLLNNGDKNQCHVSLRIILQLNENLIDKEFDNFREIYFYHSNKIGSGAWLIFTKSFNDDFVTSFFRGIYLPFNMEMIIAWINGEQVQFKEVYQVVPSYPVRQPYFGNWSLISGLRTLDQRSRHSRRTDLEGLTLNVAYIENNEPYTMRGSPKGYFFDVWKILEDVMNMSSNFERIAFQRHKNASLNSWLLIMNGILTERVHVGLADFYTTTGRIKLFDFSYPLLATNFQLFFPIFENEILSHTFLLLFENEIWLAVFFWIVIISLSLYWTSVLCRKVGSSNEIVIKLPLSFFITFSGLCGQGIPLTPKSLSCRILLLLNLITAAVLIPSYSASLTRYLAAKPTSISFRNLKDFYDTGTHSLYVIDGGFEFHIFNLSVTNVIEKKIYEKYIKNNYLPKNFREALKMVCSREKSAFFTVASNFNWELSKFENKKILDGCILRKMTQNDRMLISGILYPKKFMFKELIDHHLKKFQATGIIERLKKKYFINQIDVRKHPLESISLKESSGFFQIFILGITMSCLFVVMECILRKRKNKRKNVKKRHLQRLILNRRQIHIFDMKNYNFN